MSTQELLQDFIKGTLMWATIFFIYKRWRKKPELNPLSYGLSDSDPMLLYSICLFEYKGVIGHTDPEEGIGQTECSGKTTSGPRSPATIGKRQ